MSEGENRDRERREHHGDEGGRHEHHEHGDEARTYRHYVADFVHNFRDYDGPLIRAAWLAVRNRARAHLLPPRIQGCCGHPGEPGC